MRKVYKCVAAEEDQIAVWTFDHGEVEFSIDCDENTTGCVVLDKVSVKALRDQLNDFLGDSNEHTL